MQRHHAAARGSVLVAAVALSSLVATACGSSSKTTTAPSPSQPSAPTSAPATTSPAPTPSPAVSSSTTSTTSPASATIATGPKSSTCVNGWIQPAPGSDFFKQASAALEQSQGATGYAVKAVRYFAGPLAGGGIGAIYYLDVTDPRLAARVVLVSGGGPSKAAVAKPGTHGWKQGDWTGFAGSQPAAVHPPLPGTWAGPEYDPVGGPTPLLSTSLAGCLAGT